MDENPQTPEKKKRGRPKKEEKPPKTGRPLGSVIPINLADLEKLSALQCTDEELAFYFGVHLSTIHRRKKNDEAFNAIIQKGRAAGKMSVRRNLFELSKKNASAAIFLAKNLLGYRDFALEKAEDQPVGAVPTANGTTATEAIGKIRQFYGLSGGKAPTPQPAESTPAPTGTDDTKASKPN